MKKVIIVVLAVIVVIAGIGLAALYFIGDRIIDRIIEAELGSIESQIDDALNDAVDSNLDDTLAADPENLDDAGGERISDESGTQKPDNNTSDYNGKKQNTELNQNNGKENQSSGEAAQRESKPETQEGASKTPADGAKPEQNSEDKTTKITTEKMKEIKDKITASDKIEAGALVLKRLTTSDIDILTKMVQGGLTKEEEKKAKQIAYERFTAEEIKKIKEIYRKYMY